MRDSLPCLPLIQERFWNAVKDKDEYKSIKYFPEFVFRMFPQTWGSTALGFGGIGGQAMTSAYTTVVCDDYIGWNGVFFGERLAYLILNPNQDFYKDMMNGCMGDVSKRGKYIRKE